MHWLTRHARPLTLCACRLLPSLSSPACYRCASLTSACTLGLDSLPTPAACTPWLPGAVPALPLPTFNRLPDTTSMCRSSLGSNGTVASCFFSSCGCCGYVETCRDKKCCIVETNGEASPGAQRHDPSCLKAVAEALGIGIPCSGGCRRCTQLACLILLRRLIQLRRWQPCG